MNYLKLTYCLLLVSCFTITNLKSQPNIGNDVLYGYVHEQTGLLFIRTPDAFYSIDGYSDQYTKIEMGVVEKENINQPKGTPYLFVYSPFLNILDLVENKVVFEQQTSQFDDIYHVDLLAELDAFFIIASEKSESDEFLKTKTISFFLIDILTGETIWKFTPKEDQGKFLKASTEKPIVFENNRVIFPFGNNLYCLDSQLGTFVWKTPYKRPNLLKSLASLFALQQPSEYFKHGKSLIIFENYKVKKIRHKSIRAMAINGGKKWELKLSDDERIGDVWNDYIQINTPTYTKMIDLNTGSDAWQNPVSSDMRYFSYFIHPNQKYLLTKESPKSSEYPVTYNAISLKTGKSIWKSPKEYPNKKRRVTVEKLGLSVYDREEKELTYYSYDTGDPVWSYPKNQMNDYKFIDNYYYVSKDNEIDKIDVNGVKVWESSPPIKSSGIWKVIPDGDNEIIISNKKSTKKTASVISKEGKIISSRTWKISDSDSLLFVKFSQEKINYITFDGIYQLDMTSDDKPMRIAKFTGKDRQYVFDENESKILVRTDEAYHFYDFNELRYKLLSEKLKFQGDDERRVVRFISQDGVLVHNHENIAYMDFQTGLVYNNYYKYPKTSDIGIKLLKGAVAITASFIALDQAHKTASNDLSHWKTGNEMFANKANYHNRNMNLSIEIGGELVGKLDKLEKKRDARRQLAKSAKPIAVFSEKRKIDKKRTVVIVNLDPITGEELNIFYIGEKNPVYYKDPSGGVIYYISKSNEVTRFRL